MDIDIQRLGISLGPDAQDKLDPPSNASRYTVTLPQYYDTKGYMDYAMRGLDQTMRYQMTITVPDRR